MSAADHGAESESAVGHAGDWYVRAVNVAVWRLRWLRNVTEPIAAAA
jgi:hypothetical protein